jgi:UDP-glucose 4-epimerase
MKRTRRFSLRIYKVFMKCLITGGAGFIGSHIVDALVREGHEVHILDNLSTGKLENIAPHGKKVILHHGDIRDMETLHTVCRSIDVVFHEAAIASVSQSLKDASSTYQVNVMGTGNVFEAAGQAGVKKLIFASSAAIYGYAPNQVNTEALTPQPVSQYGLSKLIGEQYCRFYSEFFNMQVTCLRYFNVYGLRQTDDSDYAGVISLFVHRLPSSQNIKIFGDGQQTRDFINVADIVQANLRAMYSDHYQHEIFNVGTGQQSSILDLLSHLEKITGRPLQIQFAPERRGDLRHSLSDIGKIRESLGFIPQVSFYQGLQELTHYAQTHSMEWEEGLLQVGESIPNSKKSLSA